MSFLFVGLMLTKVNATGAKFICVKNKKCQTVFTQSDVLGIKLQKEFDDRYSKSILRTAFTFAQPYATPQCRKATIAEPLNAKSCGVSEE